MSWQKWRDSHIISGSVNELKNIDYWLKNGQCWTKLDNVGQCWTMLDKVGHLDFVMLYLCRRTQEWFPRYLCNKPQVSQIKSTNLCLQLSHQTSQAGFNRRTMGLRLPPDLLSFVSRSSLVRPSFVLRSSFVRYSLVYRRPNEDRTRNKRKTNERATNVDRENSEKLSKTRRKNCPTWWEWQLSGFQR